MNVSIRICILSLFPIIYPLSTSHMSFLFDKRTKKVVNVLWGVIAVLVMLGMIVFFAPGLTNLLLGQ